MKPIDTEIPGIGAVAEGQQSHHHAGDAADEADGQVDFAEQQDEDHAEGEQHVH
jgi:hypothetical protein